ncbi:MAG: cytochrome P450 [Acidobacteriota bacterium]
MSRADDIDLAALSADPYAALAPLRERGGTFWAPQLEMWLVTRYDDVVSVLRQPKVFSNDSEHSLIQATFGRQMLSIEGEEHRRAKQTCLAPFRGAAVRDVWQPGVESLCAALLEELEHAAQRGETPDLMAGYAGPIALRTMGLIIGLGEDDLDRVYRWYAAFAEALANFGGDPDAAEAGRLAAGAMRSYLDERLRAAEAGELSPSTLLAHLAQSDELERSRKLANLLIVLFGGIETTESMIGNALWCLFTQIEAFDGRVEALIEESLRFEPAVQTLTRHATGDVELLGARVRQGQTVQCMVSSAHRDPRAFDDPDRFDLGRFGGEGTSAPRKHLAFGLGTHFCLGAQLARLEAKSAIEALLERWPAVHLASPSPPVGHEFRRPESLLVELN